MLRDIEDTPTYRRLVQKGIEQGIEKGIEKGIEQGLEQGRLLQTRQNIEAIVRKRFPTLLTLVKTQIEQITDLEKLQEILLEVGTARTAKEVKLYLLAL